MLIIYTSASFGFSVKQFYCCNKLKSTLIVFTTGEQKKSGMNDKMDNCCKTKYQFLKVKDAHLSEANTPDQVKHFTQTDFYKPFFEQVVFIYSLQTVANHCNPPPLINAIPIYLLVSVFRI